MDNEISKVSVAGDGRLNVHPSKASSMFEYIYREAAGVYWNRELQCFQSSAPKNWDNWNHSKWYKQIVSTVRSGLGKRLRLLDTTVFEGGIETFENEIRFADAEVQKWIDENQNK
jgi:hypothetical protein